MRTSGTYGVASLQENLQQTARVAEYNSGVLERLYMTFLSSL